MVPLQEKMVFKNIYDLNYYFITEMEYSVLDNGYIYDPYKNTILALNGSMIKVTINENNIKYAGQGEVVFDIVNNLNMAIMLFSQYIERRTKEGMEFYSYYMEEKYGPNDRKLFKLVVKNNDYEDVQSDWFMNKCIPYIHLFFIMEDNDVDLTEIDRISTEERLKGESK